VVPHGELFEPAADLGRAEVRARLELPREAFVFACVGFLTPEKGFDRALDAFERLPHGRGARLCIVGLPYGPTPDAHRSVAELRHRAAQVPGAELREGYLAAAAFDLWLRAADVVLTPSRAGASPSVVARAELFATPLITSATGDPAAAGADVTVVHDDEELYEAMARKLGESSSPSSRNGRV
jgi:glycosyltransferase involved in cell wall biosynthesis